MSLVYIVYTYSNIYMSLWWFGVDEKGVRRKGSAWIDEWMDACLIIRIKVMSN